MNQRYAGWSKQRRYDAAIDKVINSGWTQKEAAEQYGVSRQHLNKRVREAREALEQRVLEAKVEAHTGGVSPASDLEEFPSFEEWFELYFGSWICPDCEVHHQMPPFHSELAAACQDPSNRRVLINLPPYHAKSTLVTVFDTVYKICKDRNHRTVIVSKSKEFAQALVRQIQEILTNEELYMHSERNLIDDFGPFKPEGQATWNQTEFIVSGRTRAEKDPTVLALGFGSQIYGRRADEIKFDDVATLENSRNPERVSSMLEWIDKEALSRIGKTGRAIWVGTRVSAGDIYLTLGGRPGYKVIRYSLIVDDNTEEVLWPEHFPYSQALIHRSEMSPADFQLVYQNVDVPGLGASFTEEMMDLSKDMNRVRGQYDPSWRLIGGLDPAGANKNSGYTAFTVLGVDMATGRRYLVDQVAVKQMKAPQMKQHMLDWSDLYPIFEWRVESNGVQSQLIQYDREIITTLAQRGIRVTPHHTHSNKWDSEFGVESMAPLWHAELVSIPWGNAPTRQAFQPSIEEFIGFPMAVTSDRVMSWWFAELGIRDLLRRQHLPMFNERQKVPARIRKKRRIVSFADQTVRPVSLEDQRGGHLTPLQSGMRRQTLGRPVDHDKVVELPPADPEFPPNIDPRIWGGN